LIAPDEYNIAVKIFKSLAIVAIYSNAQINMYNTDSKSSLYSYYRNPKEFPDIIDVYLIKINFLLIVSQKRITLLRRDSNILTKWYFDIDF
jgi:hypothetical protein